MLSSFVTIFTYNYYVKKLFYKYVTLWALLALDGRAFDEILDSEFRHSRRRQEVFCIQIPQLISQ